MPSVYLVIYFFQLSTIVRHIDFSWRFCTHANLYCTFKNHLSETAAKPSASNFLRSRTSRDRRLADETLESSRQTVVGHILHSWLNNLFVSVDVQYRPNAKLQVLPHLTRGCNRSHRTHRIGGQFLSLSRMNLFHRIWMLPNFAKVVGALIVLLGLYSFYRWLQKHVSINNKMKLQQWKDFKLRKSKLSLQSKL